MLALKTLEQELEFEIDVMVIRVLPEFVNDAVVKVPVLPLKTIVAVVDPTVLSPEKLYVTV